MSDFDLHLAWRRLKQDRPLRSFVQHPYAVTWIDRNLDEWLVGISARLQQGYVADQSAICQQPKGGPLVRPGSVLSLADETLFNALIGCSHAQIYSVIGWSQGDPDVAHQLNARPDDVRWVKGGFRAWKEFADKSLKLLNTDVQFVAVADIAGFYENIDLDRVSSDLAACGVEEGERKLLSSMLRSWAYPRGKGLPQGFSAADILAKLYMNDVDLGLRNAGFRHLRYVDDIRVFCRTRLEAKQALLKLNELIRIRGLNLQSAKTEIIDINQAHVKIAGVAPIIRLIHEQWTEALAIELGPMLSASEMGEMLGDLASQSPDKPEIGVLEQAFRSYFSLAAPGDGFDKTLFHYLLNHLGKAQSTSAARYCVDLLRHRPEETEYCLRYLGEISALGTWSKEILEFAGSSDAIYDYQLYLIVKAYFDADEFPLQLQELCRKWARDRNRERWLRTYSVAVLGASGNPADLVAIEASYAEAADEWERAEIARALKRMEAGRRNAFYGRVRGYSDIVEWAIDDVKGG